MDDLVVYVTEPPADSKAHRAIHELALVHAYEATGLPVQIVRGTEDLHAFAEVPTLLIGWNVLLEPRAVQVAYGLLGHVETGTVVLPYREARRVDPDGTLALIGGVPLAAVPTERYTAAAAMVSLGFPNRWWPRVPTPSGTAVVLSA